MRITDKAASLAQHDMSLMVFRAMPNRKPIFDANRLWEWSSILRRQG